MKRLPEESSAFRKATDPEKEKGMVSVRKRNGDRFDMSIEEFVKLAKEQIRSHEIF